MATIEDQHQTELHDRGDRSTEHVLSDTENTGDTIIERDRSDTDLFVHQSGEEDHSRSLPTDTQQPEGNSEIYWQPGIKGFWTNPGQLYVFWDLPNENILCMIGGYQVMVNGVKMHRSLLRSNVCSTKISGLTGGKKYNIDLRIKVASSYRQYKDLMSNTLCFVCPARISDQYVDDKGDRQQGYQHDSPLISIEGSQGDVCVVWMEVDYADSYQVFVNGKEIGNVQDSGYCAERRWHTQSLNLGDKIQLLVLTKDRTKKWSNMITFGPMDITVKPCLGTLPTLMPGDVEPVVPFSKRECKVFIPSRLIPMPSVYCACGRHQNSHDQLTILQGQSNILLFTTKETIPKIPVHQRRVVLKVTALIKESVLSIGIISSMHSGKNSEGFHGHKGITCISSTGIQPNLPNEPPALPYKPKIGDKIEIRAQTGDTEDGEDHVIDVEIYLNDSKIPLHSGSYKLATPRLAIGLGSGSSLRVLEGNMIPLETWTSGVHTETSPIKTEDCGTLKISGETHPKYIRISTEITTRGGLDWNQESFKEKLYQLLFKQGQVQKEATNPLVLLIVGSSPANKEAFVERLRQLLKNTAVLLVTDGEGGGLSSLAADAIDQLHTDEKKSIKLLGVTGWGYGADSSFINDVTLNSPNQFTVLEARCDQFLFLDWGTVGIPTDNSRPLVWFMTYMKEKYKVRGLLLVVNGKMQLLGHAGDGPLVEAVIARIPVLVMGNEDLALYIRMAWKVFIVSPSLPQVSPKKHHNSPQENEAEKKQKFEEEFVKTRYWNLVQQEYSIEQSHNLFLSDFMPRTKQQVRVLDEPGEDGYKCDALERQFLFAFGVKSLPRDWKLEEKVLIELYNISGALSEDKHNEERSEGDLIKIGNRINQLLHFNLGNLYPLDESVKTDPSQHLFLAALLSKDAGVAKIHWQNVKFTIASGLVGSIIMSTLAKEEEKSGHVQEVEELHESSEEFLHEAGCILDAAYDNELRYRKQLTGRGDGTSESAAKKTLDLLLYEMPEWKDRRLLDLIDMLPEGKQLVFKNRVACKKTVDYLWISDHGWQSKFLHYLAVTPPGWLLLLLCWIFHCLTPEILQSLLKKHSIRLSSIFIKFMLNTVSYIFFLLLFSYFVLVELHPFAEPNWWSPVEVEVVIWIWAVTLFVEELRQILTTHSPNSRKFVKYWSSNWNRLDMGMFMLLLISIVLRFIVTGRSFVWARIFYCITVMAYYVRLLHICYAIDILGPKITTISRMLYDLLFFLLILVIFMIAYGVSVHAIQYPNTQPSWDLVKNIIYMPYWQIYGELKLENLEVSQADCEAQIRSWNATSNDSLLISSNDTLRNETSVSHGAVCPENHWFIFILLAVYMILVNVLLLNLLIAMFSNTFNSVESKMEVRYPQLFDLVFEYKDKPYLPPPLNIIYFFSSFIFEIAGKCCRNCRKPKDGRKEWNKDNKGFEYLGCKKYQEKFELQKTHPQDVNRTLDELQDLFKMVPFKIEFNPSMSDIYILEALRRMTERTTEQFSDIKTEIARQNSKQTSLGSMLDFQSSEIFAGRRWQKSVNSTFDSAQYYRANLYIMGVKVWLVKLTYENQGQPVETVIIGGLQVFYNDGQSQISGDTTSDDAHEFRLNYSERITKVRIRCGDLIDSLSFTSQVKDHPSRVMEFGGTGGSWKDVLPPCADVSYLAGINGRVVEALGVTAIDALSFTWATEKKINK